MIQAIVFLPLLGAFLAGLIALFGAHGRNPSGDEMDHGAHDAHAHVSIGHDHHHDDHHAEPAAAGSRVAELFTTALLLISAGLSWVTFVDVGFLHHDARLVLLPWM